MFLFVRLMIKEVLIPLIIGKFVIEISEHIIVDWEID